MLPISPYYIPAMKNALNIIDEDKSKSGLSYVKLSDLKALNIILPLSTI